MVARWREPWARRPRAWLWLAAAPCCDPWPVEAGVAPFVRVCSFSTFSPTLLHHATQCMAGSCPGPHLGGWSRELVCAESSPARKETSGTVQNHQECWRRLQKGRINKPVPGGDWLTGCPSFVNSSGPASSAETWWPHLRPGRGWRVVSLGVQCSLAFAMGPGIGCSATRPGWFSYRTEVTKPRVTLPLERPLPGTGASISWPLSPSFDQEGHMEQAWGLVSRRSCLRDTQKSVCL